MHTHHLGVARAALVLSLFLSTLPALADDAPGRSLALGEAIGLAREHNPLLEAARARIGEAEGDLTQASVLLVRNPRLSLSAGPRFLSGPGGGSELDAQVGLQQRLEIGGQRRHRVERAKALQSASQAQAADVDRVVTQSVALVFFEVLGAANELELVEENAKLAESLYEIARSRVSAGAAAPLEENTARIRRADATRMLVQAEARLRSAEFRLATTLGLSSAETVHAQGELPESASLPPLGELLAAASENHPRLLAARSTVDASQSDSALADAEAWPDLTLGASYSREERDDVVMGGVTIPIPVFNRNQGERVRAKAAARRTAALARSLQLEIESEIRRSYANYEAATRSLAAFDADVLRSQDENLDLIEAMFQAGKIRYVDVILLQREVIEGRLGYLNARLELARAEVATRSAAGIALTQNFRGNQP
jgi:outer membrane protein, heavy metal efflux system